jgi:hypothetical protein
MKSYIKNELGFDMLFPLDLKKNEFLAIGKLGRTYNKLHSIYLVRFDSDVYKNMRPNVTYESVELSFSKKSEAIEVSNYLQRKKLF